MVEALNTKAEIESIVGRQVTFEYIESVLNGHTTPRKQATKVRELCDQFMTYYNFRVAQEFMIEEVE